MQTKSDCNGFKARKHISGTGSFASLPSVFEGVEEGVKHSVKIEFSTEFKKDALESSNRFRSLPLQLETVFSTDWLLLDIGAADPSSLDSQKIARDCELLREIALNHPEKIQKIIGAFQPDSPLSAISEAFDVAKDIGLTEEAALKKGGGWIHVAILVGGALLLSCAHNKGCQPKDKPQHTIADKVF